MNLADDLVLRAAARVSYSHAATFVCTDSGTVLDSPEVRYGANLALEDGASMYCVRCGGPVTYLKYWPFEHRAEHT